MGMHKTIKFDSNRLPNAHVTSGWAIGAIVLFALSPSWGQKTLLLKDAVYEPQIRTVVCYGPQQTLPSSVANMTSQNLVLEFDDLQEERNNYYGKLIHCNFDWTKSTLMDLDILRDYNEFPINDYSFSINTHIPYIHYKFPLPSVKIPGNYVVVIYRDGNTKDIVLSRRIMVFDLRTGIAQNENISGLEILGRGTRHLVLL